MEPFRDLDVPRPKEGFQASIMLDPVEKILYPSPATVSSSDSVSSAVDLMRQFRAGAVLVVDNGRLSGILSEVDLLFKASGSNAPVARVDQFMTPNPVCLEEDSSIASALHAMSVGGYRHLPVMRNNKVVGIVSIKDVLRYLSQQLL
jgi:CBS domain-containing protein